MRILFTVVLMICLIAVSLDRDAYAGGSKKGTKSNEGVCDGLQAATPGLYGLCQAFCEAQDCQPDLSAPDPFADCRPSAPKLLENYRKKMGPDDPDMPCVKQAPTVSCPCFSQAEMFSMSEPFRQCYDKMWVGTSSGGGYMSSIVDANSKVAQANNFAYASAPFVCFYRDPAARTTAYQAIGEDEYVQCVGLIRGQIGTGGACR